MGKLSLRYQMLCRALKMLDVAIEHYATVINRAATLRAKGEETTSGLHFSALYLATRESMIQRFEYYSDLF